MLDPVAPFPAAEYRARCEAIQARMASAGLDALLLTLPADIYYVTGFLTRFWESPTRPWFVIVPASGDPVAVIPAIGGDLMARTWLSDIRTWPAPDPRDDGIGLLSDALVEMVPDRGRIGVPMGPETHLRMPLAGYSAMAKGIAPRRLLDGSDVIRGAREIKSEAEIDRVRETCRIAGAAFARVPRFAGKGVASLEVFRSFQIALMEAGADWVSYVACGAGPDGYDDVISPAGDRALAKGDVLMLDTGAVRAGYFCDFDRNYAVGRPSDAVRRAHDALFATTEMALAAVKPGMRASDLHAIMYEDLRARQEAPLGGRFGHGVGVSLTEWPSLMPGDDTVLSPGMVLALEPGVEIAPGKIMVHEENVVLRSIGAELLSPRAPAEIPVI